MPDLSDAFLAFGLALVVVWISTPVVKSFAWRIGAIDEPRARGLHQFPTPRLGGLAILIGIIAPGPAKNIDFARFNGVLRSILPALGGKTK